MVTQTWKTVRIFISSTFRDMHAERYTHMARYLSTISEKMKQAQDLLALTGILEEANEIMFLENWDWRVAFRLRKMEVP